MKRFLSLFLSALMVLSCLTALTVFAADAPAIDGQYLLMTADDGNGLSQSDANALKGSDGFTYTEDLEITSLNSGAYFGIWFGKGNGYIAGYNANTEEINDRKAASWAPSAALIPQTCSEKELLLLQRTPRTAFR